MDILLCYLVTFQKYSVSEYLSSEPMHVTNTSLLIQVKITEVTCFIVLFWILKTMYGLPQAEKLTAGI